MDFLNILKKNDKEFEKTFIQEVQKIEIIVETDSNIKNAEDEFEKIYMNKIEDIKFDFKEYIENEGYPFLNKTNFDGYSFYDFIKYNSINFYDLEVIVENENKEYLEFVQEEEDDFTNDFE